MYKLKKNKIAHVEMLQSTWGKTSIPMKESM